MITALRQPIFPAASEARTITVLFPISNGIEADHAVVPDAAPDVPKFVAQETCVTLMLSLAVPPMVTDAAVVDIVPVEGEVIVRLGAVVSVIIDCRVTETDFDARLPPAMAVTVMTFAPIISGILEMLQAEADTAAVPEPPPLDVHVMVIALDPPPADPDKLTLEAPVVEATPFTVSVRGEPDGGGMVVEVCAA